MITNEEIDEIFYGCTIFWSGASGIAQVFKPSSGDKNGFYITTSTAIKEHLNCVKNHSATFRIHKIELTEENKRKLYEWLACQRPREIS